MHLRKSLIGNKKVDGCPIRKSDIENKDAKPRTRGASSSSSTIGSSSKAMRPSSVDNPRLRTPLNANSRSMLPFNPRLSSGQRSLSSDRGSSASMIQHYLGAAGIHGTNIQSALGRSSAIGARKEMNDKNCQRQMELDLVEFCRLHEYSRSDFLKLDGPTKSFPLTSTEFRPLFTFLVRFLDPSFQEPEAKTYAEHIPIILKKMGYPTHVSKQTFQTLGTKHSWSSVLAVLQFILKRAKLYAMIDENCENMVFSNKDDNGFEDTSVEPETKIRHEYLTGCYNLFNEGSDDYNKLLDDMEGRLCMREGVDLGGLDTQKREFKETRQRLEKEQSAYHDISKQFEMQQFKLNDKQKDFRKMKDYCENLDEHNEKKGKEKELLAHCIATIKEKEEVLCQNLSELRNVCINDKNIDPDEKSPKINSVIDVLEKKVNDAKNSVKCDENLLWQKEMEVSKILKDVEDTCKSFNTELINLELLDDSKPTDRSYDHVDFPNPFKVHPHIDFNQVTEFLRCTEIKTIHEQKLCNEERKRNEKDVHLLSKELEARKTTLLKTKEEHDRWLHEGNTKEKHILAEEYTYKEKLSTLKHQINVENSIEKKDLNRLETELLGLKQEKQQLLETRDNQRENGHRLLNESTKKVLEKRKEKIKYINQKNDEYEEAVHEKVKNIDDENEEMERFVKNLSRVKE